MASPGQFTIGRILAVTCAVGLLLAVVGPRIRAWPEPAQRAVYWLAPPALALALAEGWVVLRRQSEVHHRAGALLYRTRGSYWQWSVQGIGCLFLFLAVLEFMQADGRYSRLLWTNPEGMNEWMTVGRILFWLVLSALQFGFAPTPLQCREHGILVTRFVLIEWEKIDSCRWRNSPDRMLIFANRSTTEIQLHPDDWEKVAGVLIAKGVTVL